MGGIRLELGALPHPAALLDRRGRIVDANDGARAMFSDLNLIVAAHQREADRFIELPTEDGTLLLLVDPSARRELAKLQESFDALGAQVPGALFRYILRPDGTDAVTYMNEGCVQLWEVDAAAIGEDAAVLWSMIEPEDLPAMQDSVIASAASLSQWTHEWRITTPSGTRKHVSAMGTPKRLEDGSVVWNSLIIDVTDRVRREEERRTLEEQLQQAAKMESIGRLAGGVAHDFNNMLTVILGTLEEARHGLTRGENIEALLQTIKDAVIRSTDLTRKLLTFSRTQPLEGRVLDVGTQVRDIIPLVDRLVGDDISVRFSEEGGPFRVLMDPSELDQVLTNLAANAREAMLRGGHLDLTLSAPDEQTCLLAVEDDGPGMSDEVAARIFEPFFSTKDARKNTGLGLATVYAIVQRLGGTIEVANRSEAGTRFELRLPLSQEGVGPLSKSVLSPPDRQTLACSLLIVEDDPHVRLVLARLARSLGYRTAEARSGEEALSLMQDDLPDLVLTDVSMADMDGGELVRMIEGRHPTVACVLMSGVAAASSPGERAKRVALNKPFDRSTLDDALQNALVRHRAVS